MIRALWWVSTLALESQHFLVREQQRTARPTAGKNLSCAVQILLQDQHPPSEAALRERVNPRVPQEREAFGEVHGSARFHYRNYRHWLQRRGLMDMRPHDRQRSGRRAIDPGTSHARIAAAASR